MKILALVALGLILYGCESKSGSGHGDHDHVVLTVTGMH